MSAIGPKPTLLEREARSAPGREADLMPPGEAELATLVGDGPVEARPGAGRVLRAFAARLILARGPW